MISVRMELTLPHEILREIILNLLTEFKELARFSSIKLLFTWINYLRINRKFNAIVTELLPQQVFCLKTSGYHLCRDDPIFFEISYGQIIEEYDCYDDHRFYNEIERSKTFYIIYYDLKSISTLVDAQKKMICNKFINSEKEKVVMLFELNFHLLDCMKIEF
jgi:hypothetical protein